MAQVKLLLLFMLTFFLHNLCLSSHSQSSFVDTQVWSSSHHKVFNVEHFGAKGDGTDDSKAFEKAWAKACSASSSSILLVPKNKKYTLKPVEFRGPCKSPVTVLIKGTLEAPSKLSDWDANKMNTWIMFNTTKNLAVRGGGMLDGKGQVWWQKSCKINSSMALLFRKCKNLVVEDMTVKDGQQIHVWFRRCSNVDASKITISSPDESPNTDGIHITDTKNIIIQNSIIGSGDDCISIVSGSRGVIARKILCGPGHGISIGSLGSNHSLANVSDVLVDDVRLTGTTNGLRIKTWQGGRGYAKHIIFQNIVMDNVKRPIIINQNYCDQDEPCYVQESAVAVSRVLYKNIKGTSASKAAITFNCSQSIPCRHISLQNINLVGEDGNASTSVCSNVVHWKQDGNVIPAPCALN
ncbi:polygalacturonase-like isoform X1 [Canna indica]|uniref:endo-polygalacturonase n=1 Tax=Canna indica TaxID=4628 RepID=A0AAQ3JQT3_9LILI|nr:polygalacturonase-like isoform X1 [Canna indica]